MKYLAVTLLILIFPIALVIRAIRDIIKATLEYVLIVVETAKEKK